MASNNPNLVMNVGANTSNFREGMGEASESLNEFAKKSEQTFSEMGGDIDDGAKGLKQLRDQFGEVGAKIVQMSGQAGEALGKVLGNLGNISTALGSLGIAAATAAFRTLHSEAEAFRATVEGANMQLQTQAYLETYRKFMHDVNSETGRSIAEAENSVTKAVGKLWSGVTATFSKWLTEDKKWYDLISPSAIIRPWREVAQQAGYADEAATAIADDVGVINDLMNRQLANSRRWTEMERQIAEYKAQANNSDLSVAARTEAANKARELTIDLYGEQYDLQLMISNLSDKAYGENADTNNLLEQANGILDRQKSTLDEISRIYSNINRTAAEAAAEQARIQALIDKGVSRMQEYAAFGIEMGVSDESRAQLAQFSQVTIAKPIEVPVRLETEEAEQQILNLSETIQNTIVEAISGMAASIGELLGNAINGEGGMAEFGQDVLTMIGTFAEKFGKVLVAYGAAVLAFESAFENPYAAIAAGAGLIVLGAMVKQIASNMSSSIGSGASSQSSYVASSGSYGAGGYSNSTLQVEVTGTLTANGSQLVAVLNNENNRTNYTT